MKWNSIVVKLSVAIVFIILGVLLPLGYVINNVLINYFNKKALQDVSMQSERLVEIITTNKNSMAPNLIVTIMKLTNNHVVLLDAAKQIIVHSNPTQENVDFLQDSDWDALQKGNSIQRKINMGQQEFILVANPIVYKGNFSGAVYVFSSTAEIEQSISLVRRVIWLSAGGAVLLAIVFTLIFVRKFSLPLLEMEKATRRIARGDLQVKVINKTNDEVGSLAEAINDLASDLKQLQENRSEFFSNISHELRTPLTYLEGYVKFLNEDLPENPEQRKQILQIITLETKRLKELVNDLFDLAKLEEGKFELTREWLDLAEIIQDTVEKVKLRAENKGIQVSFEEEEVPLLHLDGNRMHQVVMNLLDNAIRYTEKGAITVTLTKEASSIALEIKDTGIGIPKEEVPLIFERFHRVEKSRSREHGGTGLGLAIVKKLVELQGGTIEVSSQVGEGTTFTLYFPLPQEEGLNV